MYIYSIIKSIIEMSIISKTEIKQLMIMTITTKRKSL